MARGVRDAGQRGRGRVESEADGGCGYSTLHCTGMMKGESDAARREG